MLYVKKIVCTASGVAFKRSLMIVLLATGLSNMAEEAEKAKTTAQPLVIQKSSVFAPSRLGKVDLLHDDDGFHILQDGKQHKVQNCFVDQGLRKVDRKKLAAFLEHGYISVNKVGDDEFSLKANVRGPGGGPIFGTIVYWTVKGGLLAVPYVGSAVVGGIIGRRLGRGEAPINHHDLPEIAHLGSEASEIAHVAGGAGATIAATGGWYAFVEATATAAGAAAGMTPTP